MNTFNNDFWRALDSLVDNSEIVIVRPKGNLDPLLKMCQFVLYICP